jgi:hypothetical protein
MATVAVTSKWTPESGQKHVSGIITMSNSYSTGGEAIAIPGMEKIAALIPSPANGRTFWFDGPNAKLKAFTAATTEVSAATDLSGAANAVPFYAIGF